MCADEKAFGIIYDQYAGIIYRLLITKLKDQSSANIVLENVFLATLKENGTFRCDTVKSYRCLIKNTFSLSTLFLKNKSIKEFSNFEKV